MPYVLQSRTAPEPYYAGTDRGGADRLSLTALGAHYFHSFNAAELTRLKAEAPTDWRVIQVEHES